MTGWRRSLGSVPPGPGRPGPGPWTARGSALRPYGGPNGGARPTAAGVSRVRPGLDRPGPAAYRGVRRRRPRPAPAGRHTASGGGPILMDWAMFATVVGAALSVVGSVWQSGHRTRKALAAHETRCADDGRQGGGDEDVETAGPQAGGAGGGPGPVPRYDAQALPAAAGPARGDRNMAKSLAGARGPRRAPAAVCPGPGRRRRPGARGFGFEERSAGLTSAGPDQRVAWVEAYRPAGGG